jgi:hypothetical membrane protein
MLKPHQAFLSFGVIAAAVFTATFIVLGMLTPGYDPVSQTISELGEHGSPFEIVFRVMMATVAVCLSLFAYGGYRASRNEGCSIVPALLLAAFAITEVGIAVFESPHSLHNVFGISSTVGFLAPLGLAATWRAKVWQALRGISAIAAVLLIAEIVLNLSPLFVEFGETDYIPSHYGAIQRSLYFTFYGWLSRARNT